MKYLAVLILALSIMPVSAIGSVTIIWDAVTKDINNNDETGTIYYYIFCKQLQDEEPSWDNWVGATTLPYFVYSDPRQSDPEITLYYQVLAVDEFGNSSSPIEAGDDALPAELSTFEIVENDGRIDLIWVTASEQDIAGYNILKAETISGPFVKINTELVPGSGNTTSLSHYEYTDSDVEPLNVYYYKVQVVDLDGSVKYFGPQSVYVKNGMPESFAITQNYPNPFNPATNISYSIPKDSPVELLVYNIHGEHVITLVDEKKPVGTYTVTWNGRDSRNSSVASGIYFYKIKASNYTETKTMLLLK